MHRIYFPKIPIFAERNCNLIIVNRMISQSGLSNRGVQILTYISKAQLINFQLHLPNDNFYRNNRLVGDNQILVNFEPIK